MDRTRTSAQLATDLGATSPPTALRRPARWLILSLVAFIAWLATVVATIAGTGVETSADLTRAQMDSIRTGWALVWPLYTAAVMIGAVGMTLLNRSLGGAPVHRWTAASSVFTAVSVVAIVVNLVLSELQAGFDEARLGLSSLYTPALVASYLAIWAALMAVLLTGVALHRTGVLRRVGLVVAVLAGAILLLDALTRGFPPFVVALLWLTVGIALLRRREPSPR